MRTVYLAYATLRISRITVTLIWPGYCISFSIFCEIRGWLEHSVTAAGRTEAREQFEAMKDALGSIVDTIPLAASEEFQSGDEQMKYVEQQLVSFVTLFPGPRSVEEAP